MGIVTGAEKFHNMKVHKMIRAIVLRREVIFSLRSVRNPPAAITGGANAGAGFDSLAGDD